MSSVQSLLVNVVLPFFGSFLFTVVSYRAYMKFTVIIPLNLFIHLYNMHSKSVGIVDILCEAT